MKKDFDDYINDPELIEISEELVRANESAFWRKAHIPFDI